MNGKFACSLMATRNVGSEFTTGHTVCMVHASTRYEASGKAMAIAKKAYPAAEGWNSHHVAVCPETHVVDPDSPIFRSENPL
jgi:hypothetical protein